MINFSIASPISPTKACTYNSKVVCQLSDILLNILNDCFLWNNNMKHSGISDSKIFQIILKKKRIFSLIQWQSKSKISFSIRFSNIEVLYEAKVAHLRPIHKTRCWRIINVKSRAWQIISFKILSHRICLLDEAR